MEKKRGMINIPANLLSWMSKGKKQYLGIYKHHENNIRKYSVVKAVNITAKELKISERKVYRAVRFYKDLLEFLSKNH